MDSIGRKRPPHDAPCFNWHNPEAEVYMITICTKPRGINQLAIPSVWDAIQQSFDSRQQQELLECKLALVMPDHLHALISFPGYSGMKAAIRSFKSWLAKSQAIRWQRDFFGHRLRGWESAAEKAQYIRMNPVRAGLVESPDQWPYWFHR